MDQLNEMATMLDAEEGHAYAWGGGSLVAILLIVLLLIWLL
ncbi:MAG TPA: hypothetical protein VFY90_15115 [Tepidiformaceae bacterium]|nr:hypothetical protein [Tepidiformaceae bacterium]